MSEANTEIIKTQSYINFLKEIGVDDKTIERVQFKIEVTEDSGQLMGEHFGNLFKEIEFDPKLISTNGAISFDVYFGNEIVAMKRFNPKKLIVTESSFATDPELVVGELWDFRKPIIEILGDDMNFELLFHSLWSSIDKLKSAKTSDIGLVTWLNVYPSKLRDAKGLEDFIRETSDLLVTNGLILISAQSTESFAEDTFEKLSRKIMPGYKIESFVSNEYGNAGKYFLTIRKISR
jgi:hypothetical protein